MDIKENIDISVIVPVYNGEKYIERALDSIFYQTRLPKEVILIDDGSEDRTVEVIKKYKETHFAMREKIFLFVQKNCGAGAARNYGIQQSTGTWIMFLDSDDLWEKNKIEKVIHAIIENPQADVIAHNEYEALENNIKKRKAIRRNKNYQETEDLFLQLYKGNLFSTSCMTIKRDVLEKAGAFDETLLSAQDYDLWIRIGKYGKLVYMDDFLATYVIRKGNITGNTYRRYLCEMKICKKYKQEVLSKARETGKLIIKRRIFQIHKIEAYTALKKKQFSTFFKIMLRFPVEYVFKC